MVVNENLLKDLLIVKNLKCSFYEKESRRCLLQGLYNNIKHFLHVWYPYLSSPSRYPHIAGPSRQCGSSLKNFSLSLATDRSWQLQSHTAASMTGLTAHLLTLGIGKLSCGRSLKYIWYPIFNVTSCAGLCFLLPKSYSQRISVATSDWWLWQLLFVGRSLYLNDAGIYDFGVSGIWTDQRQWGAGSR